MSDLLTLVGALYACNLMAKQAPLPYAQVQSCVRVHETIRAKFLSETEVASLSRLPTARHYKIKLRGYTRFKKWEEENPDIVRKIRAEQSQRLSARTNTIGIDVATAQEYTLKDRVYAHYRCDAEMVDRRLSVDEIAVCGVLYARLKLHFVEEIDWESYKSMDMKSQSAVSRRGYLAFKAWEKTNSSLVAELEAKAGNQLGF